MKRYKNYTNRNSQRDSIDLKEFCHMYSADTRPGHSRYRAEPINYTFFKELTHLEQGVTRVETIDINLSNEDFKLLLEDLSAVHSDNFIQYDRQCRELGEHFMVELYELRTQKSRERKIRESHPGVLKAWENYQIMLKLVGE